MLAGADRTTTINPNLGQEYKIAIEVEGEQGPEEKEESMQDVLVKQIPDVIQERLLNSVESASYFAVRPHNIHYFKRSDDELDEENYEDHLYDEPYADTGYRCASAFNYTPEKEAKLNQNGKKYKEINIREGAVGKIWIDGHPAFLSPGKKLVPDNVEDAGIVDVNAGYTKHGTLHVVNVLEGEFYYAKDHQSGFKLLEPGRHFIESPTLVIKKIEVVGLVMRIKEDENRNNNVEEKKASPADARIKEGQNQLAGDLNKGYRVLFITTPEGKVSVLNNYSKNIFRGPGVSLVEPDERYVDRVTTKEQTATVEIKEAHTEDHLRVSGKVVGLKFQIEKVDLATAKFGLRNIDGEIKRCIEARVIETIKKVNYLKQFLGIELPKTNFEEEEDAPVAPSCFEEMMGDLKNKLTGEFAAWGIKIEAIPCPELTLLDEPVREAVGKLSAKAVTIKGEGILKNMADDHLTRLANTAVTLASTLGCTRLAAFNLLLDRYEKGSVLGSAPQLTDLPHTTPGIMMYNAAPASSSSSSHDNLPPVNPLYQGPN